MTRTKKRFLCALTAAALVSSVLPGELPSFPSPLPIIYADAANSGTDITANGSCRKRGTAYV